MSQSRLQIRSLTPTDQNELLKTKKDLNDGTKVLFLLMSVCHSMGR
jgi:hypothetical protein